MAKQRLALIDFDRRFCKGLELDCKSLLTAARRASKTLPCRFPGTNSATAPSNSPTSRPAPLSEATEKQTLWNEFFDVFGIQRRLVASFEEPVKRISGQDDYIGLFWKSTLLVEHKSAGQDLGSYLTCLFRVLHSPAHLPPSVPSY